MRPPPWSLVLLVVVACRDAGPAGPDAPGGQLAAAPVAAGPGARDDEAAAPAVTRDAGAAPAAPPVPLDGHDFAPEARELLRLALCAPDAAPAAPAAPAGSAAAPAADPRHCRRIAEIRERFRGRWLTPARTWFAQIVPADVPTRVVYPFAGGDLATALTVFPDAEEITTLSLEPVGDPRTVHVLGGRRLSRALDVIAGELRFLYQVNFSNTKNLIGAMRGASLPTQLVFSLSALDLTGAELVSLRYFRITAAGDLDYLDDDDLAALPAVEDDDAGDRNRAFGNAELRFRRAGATAIHVHRHIQWNLDDAHLGADDRVLRHLSKKGQVAAMTKAAAYLLGWSSFSLIRGWLVEHAVWMVSDASGIPPQLARPAGLVQEVWGSFAGAHMKAGTRSDVEYRRLFASQPTRPIPVRFGYPDVTRRRSHLIVTRRP